MSPATRDRCALAGSIIGDLYRVDPPAAETYCDDLIDIAVRAFAAARNLRDRTLAHARMAEAGAAVRALYRLRRTA